MAYARVLLQRTTLAAFVLAAGAPSSVSGQDPDCSTLDVVTGATLGTASGSVLGLIGGAGFCSRTLSGPRCPAVFALLGGTTGGIAGTVIGSEDREVLHSHLRGAGIGSLVGVAVGLALSRAVRQYGP
jgi:hypothetical protein